MISCSFTDSLYFPPDYIILSTFTLVLEDLWIRKFILIEILWRILQLTYLLQQSTYLLKWTRYVFHQLKTIARDNPTLENRLDLLEEDACMIDWVPKMRDSDSIFPWEQALMQRRRIRGEQRLALENWLRIWALEPALK